MKIVILLGVGLLAVWGLLWVGSRIPVRHRHLNPAKLLNLLYTLLHNGSDGSILVVTVRGDGRFTQFRLRMPPGGEPSLEFGFPRAPWSAAVFDDVADMLRAHGRSFERVPAQVGAVTEFLLADFEADVAGAQQITTALLTDVYGVVPERDCYATLEGDFSSRAVAARKQRVPITG
ncbi:MAG TPA: hypothetical protein VJT67_09890 [Longimicrobiaceae bacterium]|nr:hypothetical protein [Longimicrobiaceae bacterium]